MTDSHEHSRVTAARARAGAAKRALAVGAAAVFGVALILARLGHPGHAGGATPAAGAGTSSQQSLDTPSGLLSQLDGNDDGSVGAPIAPAPVQSSPQVQTGSS